MSVCVCVGWGGWGRVRGSRCDSLATPPHACPYPLAPALPLALRLCLNICNMLREREQFEFLGGSMHSVCCVCMCVCGCLTVCVCVRVYLAPQMRFLCVGWRLAACGCRLMEFRSGIKCDTQKLPIGIHIYSYCQSYTHPHTSTDTVTVTATATHSQCQSQWNRTLCRPLSVSCGLACLSVKLTF